MAGPSDGNGLPNIRRAAAGLRSRLARCNDLPRSVEKWRRIAAKNQQIRRSRPISRVLSRTTIPLGCASPRTSSDLPGSLHGPCVRRLRTACFPIWSCSRRGLPCHRMLPPARCALTAPFHPYRPHCCGLGGLLSVALSVGSRPPGVTWRLALGSPDFPPRLRAAVVWPTPARMVRAAGHGSKSIALVSEPNRDFVKLRALHAGDASRHFRGLGR